MSRTFRRKNFEKTKRFKVPGSKISGLGIYTQEKHVYMDHSVRKIRKTKRNELGYLEYVDTKIPAKVPVPFYGSFDLKKFYKDFWNVHSDHGYGDRYSANRFISRFYNKVLKGSYKEYITNYIKYGDEVKIFNPKIKGKNANWDYF